MDTSQRLGRHGFILLFVLFAFCHVFGLASEVDVSYGEKRIKTDRDTKRFLSDSYHHPRSKSEGSHQQGKQHLTCMDDEIDPALPDFVPSGGLICMDGYVMTKIDFAEYGNPTGTCSHYRHGNCGAPATMRLVKKNCLGKFKCELFATDEMFGPSHCKGDPTLKVQATCTKTS